MEIIFQYDNVESSKRLEDFATEKLNGLFKKYDFIIRADVFFKKENTSSDETGMICSVRLSIPGPRLFADSSNENFLKSIAESIDDLERQLRKKKEKMTTH